MFVEIRGSDGGALRAIGNLLLFEQPTCSVQQTSYKAFIEVFLLPFSMLYNKIDI